MEETDHREEKERLKAETEVAQDTIKILLTIDRKTTLTHLHELAKKIVAPVPSDELLNILNDYLLECICTHSYHFRIRESLGASVELAVISELLQSSVRRTGNS